MAFADTNPALLLIDVQETIFKTAKEAELAQKEGEKP